MHIDVYIHDGGGILQKLDLILQNQGQIMADLTALTAAVARETEVADSAIVLIRGLADQLAAAGTDPVALQQLADRMNSESQLLADAVTANTPVALPPPVAQPGFLGRRLDPNTGRPYGYPGIDPATGRPYASGVPCDPVTGQPYGSGNPNIDPATGRQYTQAQLDANAAARRPR